MLLNLKGFPKNSTLKLSPELQINLHMPHCKYCLENNASNIYLDSSHILVLCTRSPSIQLLNKTQVHHDQPTSFFFKLASNLVQITDLEQLPQMNPCATRQSHCSLQNFTLLLSVTSSSIPHQKGPNKRRAFLFRWTIEE